MSPVVTFPDAVPRLAADTLRLRELVEDDIPAWFERATDVESADLAGDPVPASIELGTAWLQRHRDRFHQQAAIRWAIVPADSNVCAGTIGLAINAKDRSIAELGIVIGRTYWGKGIATAATRLVTSYAFNTLCLREIQAEVLQRNPASIRLLEKTGFQRLRAIPGDPQAGGDSEDCFLYASVRRKDGDT